MDQKKTKKIKIELNEEVAQGNYVNLPIVGYSQAEFILDFIKVIPGILKQMSNQELLCLLCIQKIYYLY